VPDTSICLLSGTANLGLAEEIAAVLDTPLAKCRFSRFSDGESFFQIEDNVRGREAFVIQPTCSPVNDNLMELLIMCDALRRASAGSITAVLPYYGYARQDRKVAPRTPITSKLVADLLVAAGVTRVLCLDLHAGQIQGFFNIPFDHLYSLPVFLDYLRPKFGESAVFISPDAGGVERTRAFAKRLGASLAIIDKRRERANVSEVMHLIGDVKGKDCIIVDDMIDTAGTLCNAAQAVMREGARRVVAVASHGVLSGPAAERIAASPLEEVVVSNSIPPSAAVKACPKIRYLSVGKLLGEAIRRIHKNDSVSSLFV
jgi:ribose-phosphate pyrophosphokinase